MQLFLATRRLHSLSTPQTPPLFDHLARGRGRRNAAFASRVAAKKAEVEGRNRSRDIVLNSVSPLPLVLLLGAFPGAETVKSLFGPFVELVKSWNLPDWLVHWGHPGNMAVVLFAMGGYGTYLGFRIRFSDDVEKKAMAKDLHPKLLAGMFFFFAAGATGGVTSLLTSDKPIFESPHAVTGIIGLSLLTIQTILPSLFEGKPELRNVHGILGSGIMTLFLVHAALGLQLVSVIDLISFKASMIAKNGAIQRSEASVIVLNLQGNAVNM